MQLLYRSFWLSLVLIVFLSACEKSDDTKVEEEEKVLSQDFVIKINPYALDTSTDWVQNPIQEELLSNLDEISGVIPSFNNDSCYWVNEDSGSLGKIHLYSQSGNKLAVYNFPGLDVNDMEDLTYQKHEDESSTIYIGDFGDNNYNRSDCKIIAVPDRTMTTGEEYTTANTQCIKFQYDNSESGTLNKYNCEAFIFEPISKSFYLFTKESSRSYIYRLSPPFDYDNINKLEKVGEFRINGQKVTAADISYDGKLFILKTYEYILYWERDGNEDFEELIQTSPQLLPYKGEAKGESVCFSINKQKYFTISELSNGIVPTLRHYYKL